MDPNKAKTLLDMLSASNRTNSGADLSFHGNYTKTTDDLARNLQNIGGPGGGAKGKNTDARFDRAIDQRNAVLHIYKNAVQASEDSKKKKLKPSQSSSDI